MIKSRYIIRLVTLTAALCLLFSIASFSDNVSALGNVEIYGDNNTVSTGTGNIQMQNGTVQVGSTNDSAQIVTNTGNINTTLTNFRTAFDNFVNAISAPIAILYDNITNPVYQTSASRSFSIGGKSYSYDLYRYVVGTTSYYFNFSGICYYYFNSLVFNMVRSYSRDVGNSQDTFLIIVDSRWPVLLTRYTYYRYAYDATNDVISSTSEFYYSNFASNIIYLFSINLKSYFDSNIAYLADTWYRWYNPNISLANSLFWKAYNTDTDSYDNVNLSTVYMYITWYLGQMYISATEAASDISNDVDTLGTTLTNFETQENTVYNSVKSSLDNVDDFFNLPIISQSVPVLRWLQYMWGSLGMFQSVTILSWALIIIVIVTCFYKIKRIQL